MIINREQKINNAIAFFAIKFHSRCKYWPSQTWIYKLLAFLDHRILKKTGIPCLGLNYVAMELGPVPTELYENRYNLKNDTFHFVPIENKIEVIACKEPDLSYFSDLVIDEMEQISDEFIYSTKTLPETIDAAHEEISSWKKAWKIAQENGRKMMLMEFKDEFDTDPYSTQEELTPQQEAFLRYEGINELELSIGSNAEKP